MRLVSLAALGALVFGASAVAPPIGNYGDDLGISPSTKQRRGKGQNNRRGKGKRSSPKKRPNRLTISKRVRRKHRRAR